ncbi:MAG: DUF4405 domain-containing protein [Candidatus Nanoarchaeia archaeon]|nr:DUF4405 domain-containing protein [Candidatus Nanoarchaeia archaeon]
MNKLKLKYFLDIGMLVSFLAVGITGIIKYPGFLQAIGISRQPMPFAEISNLHDKAGVALVIFVALHLILNFNWLVCTTRTFFRKK